MPPATSRRPRSVAAPAGARMGMRGGAEGGCMNGLRGAAGGSQAIAPSSGNVGERPLHRDAGAPAARLRRAVLPCAWIRCHNALRAASIICAVSGGEWRTIQKRRRAATSPGCRHAAGTPVARLRRSGKIRMAGPGGITRFAHPLPAARSCASRPLSVAAGRRRAEGIPICPSIAPLHSTRHVIVLPCRGFR